MTRRGGVSRGDKEGAQQIHRNDASNGSSRQLVQQVKKFGLSGFTSDGLASLFEFNGRAAKDCKPQG